MICTVVDFFFAEPEHSEPWRNQKVTGSVARHWAFLACGARVERGGLAMGLTGSREGRVPSAVSKKFTSVELSMLRKSFDNLAQRSPGKVIDKEVSALHQGAVG